MRLQKKYRQEYMKMAAPLPSDHEGDCVTEPVENTEEPTERVHEEGCKLAPDS